MGEGGCVAVESDILKTIIQSLRDWGRDCWCETGRDNTCRKRFDGKFGELRRGMITSMFIRISAFNLKVTDMQAAIGLAQLKKLPMFVERRGKNWQRLETDFLDSLTVLYCRNLNPIPILAGSVFSLR